MSQSKPAPSKNDDVSLIESPPSSILGIMSRLGPGLIIAGSIVGSGELIATTATGAKAGFWLLWLILIGCVIKVFVQVELGRYAITSGKKTMDAMAEVPGPRIPGHGNWLTWFWLVMFTASMAQLGGIVGGVGQALAISAPFSEYGQQYNQYAEAETQRIVLQSQLKDLDSVDASAESKPLFAKNLSLARDATAYLMLLKETEEARLGKDIAAESVAARQQIQQQLANLKQLRDGMLSEANDAKITQRLLVAAQSIANVDTRIAAAKERTSKKPNDQKAKQNLSDLTRRRGDLWNAALAIGQSENTEAYLQAYFKVRAIEKPSAPIDDKIWASIVTALTMVLLVIGRYGLIQSFATAMVGSFTLITIVNLFMLQSNPTWSVEMADIVNGMRFRLPPTTGGDNMAAITTALATFGIIGVGSSELIAYPYWCLEKGYARFTGPHDDSPEWAERARGWMRVMRWDAWCSMVVYTFATIAFYLLGAAILHPTGLDPKGAEMIRYLAVMYEPVFGTVAQTLFLLGAFAVLYSTFFVANASLARVFSDVLAVLGFARKDDRAHQTRTRILSGLLPAACLSFYLTGFEPQSLVLLSGLLQAIMLPMVAAAALYFRYRRCDGRIAPGRAWDVFLWISAAGLLIAGLWAFLSKVAQVLF